MITIAGSTLSGIAAGARLARLGHEVVIMTTTQPGERWGKQKFADDIFVDDLPESVVLPALWRDVFKKSGAHLVKELNATSLALVPAPPTRHLLPDGHDFLLPAERGAQVQAVTHHFGSREAQAWTTLLDDLDQLWTVYRRHALEDTVPITKQARRNLGLNTTVEDLATRLTSTLQHVVLSTAAEPTAPALSALPLAVERTFNRWQLVDAEGLPQRQGVLIDLLLSRLNRLGVKITSYTEGVAIQIDCRPAVKKSLWSTPPAALRPRINRTLREYDGIKDLREEVDHVAGTRTWLRPINQEALLVTTRHFREGTPDLSWGLATRSGRDWLRRTPISDARTLRASSCSLAGAEPWAELGSAALAVYALHEQLTGQDCRPSNKDFVLPRLAARS